MPPRTWKYHFANDDISAADALYAEALALGRGRAADSEQAWLLYNRALLRYHVGRHDEARSGLERARGIWRRLLGATHPFVATADANLALVSIVRVGPSTAQQRVIFGLLPMSGYAPDFGTRQPQGRRIGHSRRGGRRSRHCRLVGRQRGQGRGRVRGKPAHVIGGRRGAAQAASQISQRQSEECNELAEPQ